MKMLLCLTFISRQVYYKAVQAGIQLFKVNPAYTSQMCHNCQHIHPVKGSSYRSDKKFTLPVALLAENVKF